MTNAQASAESNTMLKLLLLSSLATWLSLLLATKHSNYNPSLPTTILIAITCPFAWLLITLHYIAKHL